MPIPIRVVCWHIGIADILVPTLGDAQLRSKVVATDRAITDSADALRIKDQVGVICFNFIYLSCRSDVTQVAVWAIREIDIHVKPCAVFPVVFDVK